MTPASQAPTLGLGDLPRILNRHRKKSLLTFCLLMATSVAVLIFLPRAFESESLLFVRVGRESVTLDPTVTTGQVIALNESRESEINSILEVIRSRAVMERVVDRIGPQAVLFPPSTGGDDEAPHPVVEALSSAVGQVMLWLEPTGPITDREKAIQALVKNCEIYNKQKSSVISVSYRAKSPQQAQKIVSAVVNEYLNEHQRIHATPGSYNFFADQTETFLKQVNNVNERLRDAKNEMELATLEGKRTLIESKIKQIATDQLAAETALGAGTARVAALEKLLTDLPSRITSQEVQGMPNVAGDNMRQKLFELEIQEKDLLSKYTQEHPLVIAVRQKVREAKQIMDSQAASRVYSTTAVNPNVQKLQMELFTERAAGDSWQARLSQLADEYKTAQAELRSLNDHEIKLGSLEREVALAESNFQTYAQKLEEARIQHSLDEERISNLNISQQATLVEKPVSPKKSLVLIAGLLASLAGAAGVAVFAEQANRKIREPREVEQQLGLPVVVSLPARMRNTLLMN